MLVLSVWFMKVNVVTSPARLHMHTGEATTHIQTDRPGVPPNVQAIFLVPSRQSPPGCLSLSISKTTSSSPSPLLYLLPLPYSLPWLMATVLTQLFKLKILLSYSLLLSLTSHNQLVMDFFLRHYCSLLLPSSLSPYHSLPWFRPHHFLTGLL